MKYFLWFYFSRNYFQSFELWIIILFQVWWFQVLGSCQQLYNIWFWRRGSSRYKCSDVLLLSRARCSWLLSCDIRHSCAIHYKYAILLIRDLIWNAFFAITCFPIVKPRSNIHCLCWTNMLPCCTSVQCTIAHPIHMKIQQSWLFIPDIIWGI